MYYSCRRPLRGALMYYACPRPLAVALINYAYRELLCILLSGGPFYRSPYLLCLSVALARSFYAVNACMYACRLFNNIGFRASPTLYTKAQYIKTLVDSTMNKIRNEKKYIYKKNFFKSFRVLTLDHIEIRPCQFYRPIDLGTISIEEVNQS
jgi:hypothetical protein